MTETSSKVMIALVILVVALSAVFTWQALQTPNYGPHSAEDNEPTVINTQSGQPVLETAGRVGINLQLKQKEAT